MRGWFANLLSAPAFFGYSQAQSCTNVEFTRIRVNNQFTVSAHLIWELQYRRSELHKFV